MKKQEPYIPNKAPFYGETTTQANYKEVKPVKNSTRKHEDNLHVGGRFEGRTTNQADFRGTIAKRTQPIKPREHRMPDHKFEGRTTAMDTYQGHTVSYMNAPMPACVATQLTMLHCWRRLSG